MDGSVGGCIHVCEKMDAYMNAWVDRRVNEKLGKWYPGMTSTYL